MERTLTAVPRWTLDAQNGAIAQNWMTQAGIPATAYNWLTPAALTCCDDLFVMPHADPCWATHGNLLSWNQTCRGGIWAGCHAVSALEDMVNPADQTQQTNFLFNKINAGTLSGCYKQDAALLWTNHTTGTIPYTTNTSLASNPFMQYLGQTDLASQNGSEQIYMPIPGGSWRSTTTLAVTDPSQSNVPANSPGPAVQIAYGRGFGDASRGNILYEAGHDIFKSTGADNIAAVRIFFNWSYVSMDDKALQITTTGIPANMTGGASYPLTASVSSAIPSGPYTFQWTATTVTGSNAGTFGPSSTTQNPTFVASSSFLVQTPVIISLVVIDACGRQTSSSFPTVVGPPPTAPNAVNDAGTIIPGCPGSSSITLNVLSNDNDLNGDPLTVTSVTGGNGVWINSGGGNVTYNPASGFYGITTGTYTVCDNTTPTNLCSSATITITVGNAAKSPTVVANAYTLLEDSAYRLSVLANDVNPSGTGSFKISSTTAPANGKVSINLDGTITYLPNKDYSGTDSFTYTACNDSGYCGSATVSITVVDDGCSANSYRPGASTAGSVTLNPITDTYIRSSAAARNFGSCATLQVNRTTGSPDRSILQFDLSTIPSGATITADSLKVYKLSGTVSYALNAHKVTSAWTEGASCNVNNVANWSQRQTAINWGLAGGDYSPTIEGTVTPTTSNNLYFSMPLTPALISGWISVPSSNNGLLIKASSESGTSVPMTFNSRTAASNKPQLVVYYLSQPPCSAIPAQTPLASPDVASTFSTTPVTINAVTNDYNPATLGNSNLTINLVGSPTSGVAVINSNAIQYTPSATYNGAVTITYKVCVTGSTVLCDTSIATVTVNNSAPVATADATSGNSSTLQTIAVKTNDYDPEGKPTVITITSAPQNGTATISGNNIIYTPYSNYTGKDSLVYQLCESTAPACSSVLCDTAIVRITVVNQPPVANNDNAATSLCTATSISVLANDVDPENGTLTISAINSGPYHGTATLAAGNTKISYTPSPGFFGTDSLRYTICDDGSPISCSNSALVTITVANVVLPNQAPVAVDDVDATYSGQSLYIQVLSNDFDPDNDNLNVKLDAGLLQPTKGTILVMPNNTIEYIPNNGQTGTDQFEYRLCDTLTPAVSGCAAKVSLCDIGKVTVTIINRPPVAIDDINSTFKNTPVSGTVATNDFDPDNNPLTFTKTSGPSHGTIVFNSDGTYTYTPSANYVGTDVITYTACDDGSPSLCASATLTITVNSNNHPPVAVVDSASTLSTVVLNGTVATNDYDPDLDPITFTLVTPPLNGTLVLNSNGSYTYTPIPGTKNEYVSALYRVCDNGVPSLCADAFLIIHVTTPAIPEICDNGIDDDGDGLIDCADPDCCGYAGCLNENRSNINNK